MLYPSYKTANHKDSKHDCFMLLFLHTSFYLDFYSNWVQNPSNNLQINLYFSSTKLFYHIRVKYPGFIDLLQLSIDRSPKKSSSKWDLKCIKSVFLCEQNTGEEICSWPRKILPFITQAFQLCQPILIRFSRKTFYHSLFLSTSEPSYSFITEV